jgi:hypothetical protein
MLACLGIAVLLFAALAVLLAPTAWGRRMKPLWLLVLFVAAVAQHFMLDFGTVLDTTMIGSVVETDIREATDLFTWGLLGHVLLVVGPAALWLVPLPVQRFAARRAALRIAVLFAASLALALAATSAIYPVLAPLVRNHMELRYLPNPIVPVWSAVRVATRRLGNRPGPLLPISVGAALGTSHAASARPPLLVLVIGETARGDHFRTQRLSARHHARAGGEGGDELQERPLLRHQHSGFGAVHVLVAGQGEVRVAQGGPGEPARRRPRGRHGGALARQPGRLQRRLRPRRQRLHRRPGRHAGGGPPLRRQRMPG